MPERQKFSKLACFFDGSTTLASKELWESRGDEYYKPDWRLVDYESLLQYRGLSLQ
jgi:hypothetical protein